MSTDLAGVVSPQLYADLILLDAELTVGLPPKMIAATGIDAVVHALAYPIGGIFHVRMACRMPWCCRMCCASMRR